MRGRGTHRKTTPKVRDGRVQKKHRWVPSRDGDAALLESAELALEARAPGVGHRHVLDELDLRRFFPCIPDWERVSRGLRAIVLAREPGCLGTYHRGIIRLGSWEHDLFVEYEPAFFAEHRATLERLGVPHDADAPRSPDDPIAVYFDEPLARAFQLVHVFVHELGHHVDRMTRRRRGEDFAEAWALEMEDRIWPRYRERFGWR